MLVQSRRQGETLCFSAYDEAGKPVRIEVTVVKCGNNTRLAIDAPLTVGIWRKELPEKPPKEIAA